MISWKHSRMLQLPLRKTRECFKDVLEISENASKTAPNAHKYLLHLSTPRDFSVWLYQTLIWFISHKKKRYVCVLIVGKGEVSVRSASNIPKRQMSNDPV